MEIIERKIRIEDQAVYQEDYQIRMIRENAPAGLLPVKCHVQDKKSFFDYDVTGKSSMKAMYEKSELGWRDLMSFLEQLLIVLGDAEKYLLDRNHILLKPEYIFYENEKYYFCYYPISEQDFFQEFTALAQYFVKRADYQDDLCTKMVCILNNGSMEENYSLEKLVAECKAEQKKVEERDALYLVKHAVKSEDLFCEEDNYLKEEKEKEEKESFFHRLFGRKKKARWGDWEGL